MVSMVTSLQITSSVYVSIIDSLLLLWQALGYFYLDFCSQCQLCNSGIPFFSLRVDKYWPSSPSNTLKSFFTFYISVKSLKSYHFSLQNIAYSTIFFLPQCYFSSSDSCTLSSYILSFILINFFCQHLLLLGNWIIQVEVFSQTPWKNNSWRCYWST